MLALVITIHIVVAVLIIGLILLQQGKGASMGASFGSGASQTVFGSRGSAPFMFKLTAVLVAVFFVTSISLSYIGKQNLNHGAASESSTGVSQADYQQQKSAQQALIDQAKSTDQINKTTATPAGINGLLQTPSTVDTQKVDATKPVTDKEQKSAAPELTKDAPASK